MTELAPGNVVTSEHTEIQQPDFPPNTAKSEKTKARKTRPTARKTIKAPGSNGIRTAQACDRCRAKKSRCDGRQPACSSCAAAGMECIVSDRLTRKSYPKGYTELLEEQSRQLIAENARLKGALSIRDEQLAAFAGHEKSGTALQGPPAAKLEKNPASVVPSNAHSVLHTHTHDSGCLCCSDSPAVHERPVSVAGSVYHGGADDSSVQGSVYSDFEDEFDDLDENFDVLSTASGESYASHNADYGAYRPGGTPGFFSRQARPAPGAFAAATAIEQMQKKRTSGQPVSEESKEQMLTALVAASVPRSTEETLFIPTLLARIGEAYGYTSTPAKLTASAIASLKDTRRTSQDVVGNHPGHPQLLALIINHDSPQLELPEAVQFLRSLGLPPKAETDRLVKTYFQEWGRVMPVIDKNAFLKNYVRFGEILELGYSTLAPQYFYESTEKLGALVVLAVSLALLSGKIAHSAPESSTNSVEYSALLAHFDVLIHEFIKPNCVLTQVCSLQSLQILALALQYCLATGDYLTCYELRGRVITMAQQLRLHRCPAAVLGLSKEMNDRDLKAFMQGERRIVFWCVYVLDVYSSLNLGVPRLLKDYEIECATPFSGKNDDDTETNENILIVNNTKLTIFGKVTRIALCLMQFSKVLGNILDTIFSRSGNYDVHEKALEKDQMLDCWRRDLPVDLRFDTDVNGLSVKHEGSDASGYESEQALLVFLYYHAKILIYLPIISKYGYHHNVGMSMKEKLALGQHDVSTNVSSMTSIQQSAVQVLHLLKRLAAKQYVLPVPLNIPREHARFAILVAKGSLDYIKGGPLHQQSKQLLLETVPLLKNESRLEIPSALTKKSASLLEYAILSILGLNLSKPSGNSLRRRIINNESMSRVAVPRNAVYGQDPMATFGPESYDVPMREYAPRGTAQGLLPESTMQNLSISGSNFAAQPVHRVSSRATSMESSPANDALTFGPDQVPDDSENSDPTDDSVEMFKFDELMKSFGTDLMGSEFVTDGSLGLVPFLNEPQELFYQQSAGEYRDFDMEV